jgi:muramoyltetrapeptide carboxypeptidase
MTHNISRRSLLAGAAALTLATGTSRAAKPGPDPTPRLPAIRPPRLKAGDTIGLFNVSAAIYEREPYATSSEALTALGFKVREAPNLRARYGHFAGTAQQRATDLMNFVADDSVQGLLAITGGSGAARVLPLLDYSLFAKHPKVIAGFSDVTALLNAVNTKTGLVTFHAPFGISDWNPFTVANFKAVLMDGAAHTMRNRAEKGDNLVQTEDRVTTLRAGTARGPLVGGNLTVLAALAGTGYLPSFDGAILFIEDINEYVYRIDRMLATLKLIGALDRVAGVVLGNFTNCGPGDGNFGTLTLDEVFDDYFLPLGVPVYRGASFGHIRRKFTLPVGAMAELDAGACTLRLLEPAVI